MLNRRSLLLGAAGVPLSLTGAAHRGAPGGATTAGALRSVRRGAVAGGRTVTPELALTHLVVTGTDAEVRLRTAAGWQSWRPATGCPAAPDRPADRPAGVLVPAAGAVEYQVRGGGEVTELNVGRTPAPRPARLTFAGDPAAGGTALAGGSRFQPPYLSRAAWGADESYRYNPDGTLDTPPAFFGVQTLTVHHSGEDNPEPDPIAHIRAIYYNQAVVMDWGDIGYQLLIDDAGRVYEGTYSDPDPIPVFGPDPGADGRPMMVNGSHVGGFNAGNVGICVLGNFMTAPPTPAARRSLTIVLALLAATTRLDPQGTTNYVNPISGATATIATIAGHQDWHNANPAAGATLCPGDYLYALLPRIRRDVAALI